MAKQPDGKKPLYAYKCKDEEYEQIKHKVRTQMPSALRGGLGAREDRSFAATFCIYAAETFRRRHEGGPWAWETVFAEIGPVPPLPVIHKWVKAGLGFWKRPLLKSRKGREFLLTLGCEGGLPLLLLRKENARLRLYFRELLTAAWPVRHSLEYGAEAAEDMARSIAARYLPRSLHQDVVFRLSSDLIQSIVKLQEQVDEAVDPIASLDRQHPDWRDGLPLSVGDAAVEALLGNLMGQAKTLARTERQRWRWRCFLTQRGESWGMERHLELPKRVTGASLQSWLNGGQPSNRLEIVLRTTNGRERIALLTRTRGTGDDAVYLCEGLRGSEVRLVGRAAEAGGRLFLTQKSEEAELPAVGGQELGPLPWVFVERHARWEMCGEGSVRCHEASARMLALDGGRCVAADGNSEVQGQAPALARAVYQLTGTVEWQHSEFGVCHIRCASQEASEEYFLLRGNELPAVLNPTPPFLGMPGLYVVGQDEKQRRIEDGLLEWRPVNAPESDWRRDATACAGKVWIRHRDTDGALRFRRHVEVVPAATRVRMGRVGAQAKEVGLIRLSGLPGVQVLVPSMDGCQFSVRPADEGDERIEIDCLGPSGLSVTQFDAELWWPDGRTLTLSLPFPRRGVAFVRGRQMLAPMEPVVLDKLASIKAVIQTPLAGQRFHLQGILHGKKSHGQELWQPLPASGESSRFEFDLHRIHDRLASMLAMTGDLDAFVNLRIVDDTGKPLANLTVARFDVALEPDFAEKRVLLPPDDLRRLGNDWQERVTVKMLPLWEPSTTQTDLERDDTAPAWKIPDALQPGPWWVLGYDGDWARFRPLLWVVEGERTEAESSQLVEAICEPNPEIRQEKLRTLVNALAADADHADWPRLFGYLQLTRTYPASSIDLFQHLREAPEAMVMALLKSADEEFNLVWSLSDQLPFSWYLVPVTAWLHAAERYFGVLRDRLADSGSDERILKDQFTDFRERVTSRQPFFRSVCDWIGERIFPDLHLDKPVLPLARTQKSLIISSFVPDLELMLLDHHDPAERFPPGPIVMELTEQTNFPERFRYNYLSYPYRPVRCAPFVAAQISLDAQDYSEALLFELRRLRDFDAEWFDNAFAWGLCLGLAHRLPPTQGAHP